MKLLKQSILGVSVTTATRKQILSYVSGFLKEHPYKVRMFLPKNILRIVTPNPEQIVLAQKDEKFKNILNEADIALPDGAGLVWGINRRLKTENRKQTSVLRHPSSVLRISGIDFMVDLCRIAAEKKGRVFLYGGRGGVAKQALVELKKTIPNLDGIAMDGPEFSESSAIDPAVVDGLRQTIRSRNIRVVFLGLGAPKQEYIMGSLRPRLEEPIGKPVILMAVGGAFDMLAGKVVRAPKVVQQIGFEWLWRFFQEPWRWKRQWALVEFIRIVIFGKIRDN